MSFAFMIPGLMAAFAMTAADPPCEVAGATSVREDVALATAGCEAARVRFSELLGVEAPRVRVVLADRSGYRVSAEGGTGVVYWPTGAALMAQAGGRGAAVERAVAAQWREVLPHETMHALTIAAFYPDGFEPAGVWHAVAGLAGGGYRHLRRAGVESCDAGAAGARATGRATGSDHDPGAVASRGDERTSPRGAGRCATAGG